MLESEYYEIKNELYTLNFRVPQSGIKFRYGKFIVYSMEAFDNSVYSVHKSSDTFREKNLFLNPVEHNTILGFNIRDTDMTFSDIKEFIYTIKNKDNPRTLSFTRVNTYEGFLKQLLFDAKYQCAVCFEHYSSINEIVVLSCSHHFHLECISEYITNKPCPICRTRIQDN